jgi:hypothetical protein
VAPRPAAVAPVVPVAPLAPVYAVPVREVKRKPQLQDFAVPAAFIAGIALRVLLPKGWQRARGMIGHRRSLFG